MFTGELIRSLTAKVIRAERKPEMGQPISAIKFPTNKETNERKQQRALEDNAALMDACRSAASEIFDAQLEWNRGVYPNPMPSVKTAAIIYRHIRNRKEL